MPGIAIDTETCTGCGRCAELCPANVLEMRDKKAVVANGTA